jgi:hypothetical protein
MVVQTSNWTDKIVKAVNKKEAEVVLENVCATCAENQTMPNTLF